MIMSIKEYEDLMNARQQGVRSVKKKTVAEKKERSVVSYFSNEKGHSFESEIDFSCEIYKKSKKVLIQKTPEPFRVLSKSNSYTFTGVFTKSAQPDYTGTLPGGKSIVLEAKCTTTDRLKQGVLSQEQMEQLKMHMELGALAFVIAKIQNRYFLIPFDRFLHMKEFYNRLYVKPDEIKEYEIIAQKGNPLPFLTNVEAYANND